MQSASGPQHCEQTELVALYLVGALSSSQLVLMEEHLSACGLCREEAESLTPVLDAVAHWPTDVLRPPDSLWGQLARRIAAETGSLPLLQIRPLENQPAWQEPAPGICCKVLATDPAHDRLSMLVRLAPGAHYPAHVHAGVEELHLLQGELWIDQRKLLPGDYNRAAPGTADARVWSETGCTCILITSAHDILR